MGKWGECLGYSSHPCPNCGRVRLERYANGQEVCEKCGWCPQEERYVLEDEIYPPEPAAADFDYRETCGLIEEE